MLTPCNIYNKSSAILQVIQPSFFSCFPGTATTVQ